MASDWTITSQRQTTVNDGANYVPAMVVGFLTKAGNAGNVTFTKSEYTVDNVTQAVQVAADLVDNIGAIQTAGYVDTGAVLTD